MNILVRNRETFPSPYTQIRDHTIVDTHSPRCQEKLSQPPLSVRTFRLLPIKAPSWTFFPFRKHWAQFCPVSSANHFPTSGILRFHTVILSASTKSSLQSDSRQETPICSQSRPSFQLLSADPGTRSPPRRIPATSLLQEFILLPRVLFPYFQETPSTAGAVPDTCLRTFPILRQ